MAALRANDGPELRAPELRAPILRPLDFLFLTRPTVMAGMWVYFFWGAWLGARHAGLPFPLTYPTKSVVLGFLASSAVLGGGCVLNQITDIESDRLNRKLFFLPAGIISVRAAWVELALLWALAWVAAAFLSPSFRVIVGAALLINLTYSAPVVAAKSNSPWDVIWNAAGFGVMSTVAGWASAAPLTPAVLAPAAAYALVVAAAAASTAIPDIEGDRAAGSRTTAARLGTRGASSLTLALLSGAAVTGLLVRDPLAVAGSLLALPLLIRAHVTGARRHRTLANEVLVLAFGVVASVWVPYLLVLLLLAYFVTRGYYRARFGMVYPGGDVGRAAPRSSH